MQKKPIVMRFRAKGDLERRIRALHDRSGGDLADVLRDLVERGLTYSDAETFNMAKSLSRLAESYDAIHDRVSTMEAEVARIGDDIPSLLVGLTELLAAGEDRQPVLLRTLAELQLFARLLASNLPAEKLRLVSDSVEGQYQHLLAAVAKASAERSQPPSKSARKERRP